MLMDPTLLELTFVKLSVGVIIGLVLGSFITMLSYRLPRKISIVTPRSACPSCKTTLGLLDLVPVFSWIFMKGKCRHCGVHIGARYVIIELIITTITAFAFVWLGFTAWLLPSLLLIIMVMTTAIIKAEH